MPKTPQPSSSPDYRIELVSFIEAARAEGAADSFIHQLLKDYGWPQREIEQAFFEVYERLTGMPIPAPRSGVGESARDAFLYLLSFVTLAIWTQALGQLAFIFINALIPDALNQGYSNPSWDVSFCLARLIVAYPVYLLTMRQLNHDLNRYREKHHSGVRKWLTYFTILIVALIAIAALIAFLTSFLQGELRPRFVLKVIVVLLIDGGVLWYYSAWLRRSPRPMRLQSE